MINKDLVEETEKLIDQCQATALESQLARSLRKPEDQQKASVKKYLTLYATVKQSAVLAQLWAAAQVLNKGST